MTYGDNCEAYKLVCKAREVIAAASIDQQGWRYIFKDRSFIEINKYDRRAAFLPTGWRVADA